jgi:hypothetical protein
VKVQQVQSNLQVNALEFLDNLKTLLSNSIPDNIKVDIDILRPARYVPGWHFKCVFRETATKDLLLMGVVNPGTTIYRPYIEVYDSCLLGSPFAQNNEISMLELMFFSACSKLLPPEAKIMVEYESPLHASTAKLLELGALPEATPLGWLLFRSGFSCSFRNWYIAEGGMEGPRKIEACKPLSRESEEQYHALLFSRLLGYIQSSNNNLALEESTVIAKRLIAHMLHKYKSLRSVPV